MLQMQERDVLQLQQYWAKTHGQPGPNKIPVAQLLQLAYLTDRAELKATGTITSGRTWMRCPMNVVTSPELYKTILQATDRYAPTAGIVELLHTQEGLSSEWFDQVAELANDLSPLELKGYTRHLPEVWASKPYDPLLV